MFLAVTPHLGYSLPIRFISAPLSGLMSLTGQYFPNGAASGSGVSQKYRWVEGARHTKDDFDNEENYQLIGDFLDTYLKER